MLATAAEPGRTGFSGDLPASGEHDRTRSVRRHQWDEREPLTMPSLFRLLTILAILGAIAYGGLYALSHFVQPKSREITVSIPPDKFFKNR
jgi:hypothetical protein